MSIQKILQQLLDHGLNDHQIAREIGTSQSIIWRLRTGKHQTTSFDRGIKIVDLHTRITKQKSLASQHKPMNTRTNQPVNDSRNGLSQAGNSPANGALTIEQVAQLFNLMQKVQK